MYLSTSGEVMQRAREAGVAEDELEDFVRRFHAKNQYLPPDDAFRSCIEEEKRITWGGYPGQIPPRRVGSFAR